MSLEQCEEMETEAQILHSPPEASKASGNTKHGHFAEAGLPSGKAKEEDKHRYGNFHTYYSTRLEEKFAKDPRLDLMKEEWFKGLSVLDIGCNSGLVTINIAKELGPRRIVGLDIDPKLVGNARRNIRHYCDESVKIVGKMPEPRKLTDEEKSKFPNNVWFVCTSYVFPDDDMLDMVIPEYNTILALSITKWIHLNWGDDGIKRFFKRAYRNLKSGGIFIVEPQEYKAYYRSAKRNASLKAMYLNLKFMPDKFTDYLLNEVGFKECIDLGVPKAKHAGFQRSILAFLK